jgi:hypothetical protein
MRISASGRVYVAGGGAALELFDLGAEQFDLGIFCFESVWISTCCVIGSPNIVITLAIIGRLKHPDFFAAVGTDFHPRHSRLFAVCVKNSRADNTAIVAGTGTVPPKLGHAPMDMVAAEPTAPAVKVSPHYPSPFVVRSSATPAIAFSTAATASRRSSVGGSSNENSRALESA